MPSFLTASPVRHIVLWHQLYGSVCVSTVCGSGRVCTRDQYPPETFGGTDLSNGSN